MTAYLDAMIDECKNAERHLRDVFGHDIPNDVLISLIPKAIRILRENKIELEEIARVKAAGDAPRAEP